MAAEIPDTRLVYVADREADLRAMMARAQALGIPADWLVRAKHNRCLPDGDGEKLWAHTTAGVALGEIAFTMPAKDEQKSRKVRQQLWTRQGSVSNGKSGTVSATCIMAREPRRNYCLLRAYVNDFFRSGQHHCEKNTCNVASRSFLEGEGNTPWLERQVLAKVLALLRWPMRWKMLMKAEGKQ